MFSFRRYFQPILLAIVFLRVPLLSFGLTLSLDDSSVPENAEVGTLVGQLVLEGEEVSAGSEVRFKLLSDSAHTYFHLEGNQLLTSRSLDYEVVPSYRFRISAEIDGKVVAEATVTVKVENLEGVWDTDGFAGPELAQRYPAVNEGDLVIFNRTGRSDLRLAQIDLPAVSAGAKILIKGGIYEAIRLELGNIAGEGPDQRIPITNFLGQIEARTFDVIGGRFWRLTGEYDPVLGLGDPLFPGCESVESEVDFGYSHGRYGIYIRNQWINESSIQLYIRGFATGFELDHIEIADGGFAGLVVKTDDVTTPMEDVWIHHLYIHDTGSEGVYLGSTQSDPQHQFRRLLIENCAFLRTGGESLQVGQLLEDCVFRNNVLWGAFDWLSPFSRYQDFVLQLHPRAGGATFSHNVVMGGAGQQLSLILRPGGTIVPNDLPITISSNLIWGDRGSYAAYLGPDGDGGTYWVLKNNFWGYADFNYNRVYTTATAGTWIRRGSQTPILSLIGNRYDDSHPGWISGNTINLEQDGNVSGAVPPPQFRNLLGESLSYPYLRWTRWTAVVGEAAAFPESGTRKGEAVVYVEGDVVQYHLDGESRYFLCLKENSGVEPPGPSEDPVWQMLTWEKDGEVYYRPPDDVRMIEGGLYDRLEIGVRDSRPPDADADGLSDEWERRYGFGAGDDASADPDGDGRSNLDEFRFRTHPLRADRILVWDESTVPAEVKLSFFSAGGRDLFLEKSSDFFQWQEVGGIDSWGLETEIQLTLTDFSSPTFFRLRSDLQDPEVSFHPVDQ